MITLILLLFQAIIAGVIQAFIYGKKGADSLPSNEHAWFGTERLLVWWSVLMASVNPIGWLILSVPMLYPIFYNGAYYQMRNRIDGSYPKGWRSDPSKTSTADFNLSFKVRIVAAIMGIVYISIILTLK